MTTHPRARAFQAGAFLALIGGILAVAPTPAMAADPSVQITNLTSGNLKGGESATLKFRVTNNNPVAPDAESSVSVTVSTDLPELRCDSNCDFTQEISPGQSKEYSVTLVAGAVASGESKSGKIQITARVGPDDATVERSATVRGDDKAPQAKEISGRVKDQDGKAVSGADVGMNDSAGHNYTTKTNGSGTYRFFSTDQNPIAPGSVTVGAVKQGFETITVIGNVDAGKGLTLNVDLKSTASPSASASPSPSVSASELPAEETPADEETTETTAPALSNTASDADDSGSGSMLFIILGGLLVAAGVGAIVLVLMRRKDTDTPVSPGPVGAPAGPRPGAVPPSANRYGSAPDATRIGGRPADATMIGGQPSLSDAPTMLQRAVPADDEFADPYGAPAAVPHAGYAPPRPGGWGAAAAAGAAAGTYGAAAQSAAPAGTYGAAPGSGAGAHGGPATPAGGAYGAPVSTTAPYGGAAGAGAYGGPPPPGAADGYGAAPANPYTRPPAQGGAYGAPAAPGEPYGQQSGAYGTPPSAGAAYGAAPDPQQYDEPTGRYNPETGGAYRAEGGYEQGGGYRSGEVDRLQPDPAAGNYRPPAQGGYPPQRAPQDPASSGAYQSGGGYPQAGGGAAGGYGADQHEQQGNAYGSWNSPAAGIDNGNPYGAPVGNYGRGGAAGSAGGGAYGAPAGNGYDEPTGYDPRAGSYGRPEGYGRGPEQQGPPQQQGPPPQQGGRGGYADGPYYGNDQQQPPPPQPPQQQGGGGRHGGPATPPGESTHPGQRRPLDWLDD